MLFVAQWTSTMCQSVQVVVPPRSLVCLLHVLAGLRDCKGDDGVRENCTATGSERAACRENATVSCFIIGIHLQGTHLLLDQNSTDFGYIYWR
jgi:hypothetical protein